MNTFCPYQIVHIHLEKDEWDIAIDREYLTFYLVFWWYGIPLGHQELTKFQLPQSAEELLDVAAPIILPNLQASLIDAFISLPAELIQASQLTAPDADTLKHWEPYILQLREVYSQLVENTVSVVICTRDRPEHLANCLQSLVNLSPPPEEIIVVDNAPSSDATRSLVASLPQVRYVLEPRPGLDYARNAGIQHSTQQIIAYTDDDVLIEPNWIQQIKRSFNNPEIMAITGLVFAAELETKAQYIFERFWSFNRGYQPLIYNFHYFCRYWAVGAPAWRVGAGANMAFRREIFAKIGEFDERLDVGAAGCSGDSEFWYRILASGFTCRYDPMVVAYHYHRREMDGLKHQIFYYMRGHVTELLIRFERFQHMGNLVRIALFPIHFLNVFVSSLWQHPQRLATFKQEILGCLSGIYFYFKHCR